MSVRKSESGQAFVLMALSLVVIMGMAALVVDVGNWYHTKRRLQATADAAALAGAQLLPKDSAGAQAMALSYANKNGGDVAGADIAVTSTAVADDTIGVRARKTDAGVFGSVLGIASADISARAKARVGPPLKARYVAPMVVFCDHPLIHNCNGDSTPDFGSDTTMDYDPMGAPGAFGMLNLDGGNGTPGSSDEADWILHGFNKYLGLGDYRSDPGAKFSSSNIQDALEARRGSVLLFPVYRQLDGQGQNAAYEIIGWIGFHLTSYEVHGNNSTLHGYFTEFIAQGILSEGGGDGGPSSSFGVKSIQLIE
ncbi:MAG TPA: pilus assembly protein TadG-related protein [Gaiellaceae bacterium]